MNVPTTDRLIAHLDHTLAQVEALLPRLALAGVPLTLRLQLASDVQRVRAAIR